MNLKKIKIIAILFLGSLPLLSWAELAEVNLSERKILMDANWHFHLGDVTEASTADYNDKAWRLLSLPHDWSAEQKPDQHAPAGNDGGYFPTGIGWYRKTFSAPQSLKGEKVWLYFEGVYMNSTVWLNGHKIGGHPYGYSSFYCEATKALLPGKRNVLAVRVDNAAQKNCRWYTGSGIYRHVWLIHAQKLHIAPWGVAVTTPKVSDDEAIVEVKATINNETREEQTFFFNTKIDGADNATTKMTLPAGSSQEIRQKITVRNPRLWDIASPNLYTAKISITANGTTVDRYDQDFGIRTISYSSDGFFLNGRSIDICGACVHHDNGILGAAAFDRAEARKVEMMKQAGFNAVRTSHNPPSEHFLDVCDRLGMLVIDEVFDGWRESKNKFDYSTLFDRWWQSDVDAMVLRDRNHPSVIAWSIGNEIIERKKAEAVVTAHKLASEIRRHDNRPVTSALAAWDSDWEIYDSLAAQLDIVGYNYLLQKHEADHKRVPNRIIWQTESYSRDAFRNWATVNNNKYVIGDFVWTGLDYLGESGIGRWWYDNETPGEHYQRPLWPCHASYCGDVDLIGWRKPISHYRNMLWNGTEKLYMAVREPDGYFGKIATGLWAVWPTWESWNWPGHEGKPIEVVVYSRYPKVRLYLGDRLIGEKNVSQDTEMKAVFTLNYTEGVLRAEGIENGQIAEQYTLATAGKPVAIRLKAENPQMKASCGDVAFIQVEVVDGEGRVCPNADNLLSASVKGNATLLAFGNADIKDTDSYVSATHKAWKGRALIVVRATEKEGPAYVTVKANGLKDSKLIIHSSK